MKSNRSLPLSLKEAIETLDCSVCLDSILNPIHDEGEKGSDIVKNFEKREKNITRNRRMKPRFTRAIGGRARSGQEARASHGRGKTQNKRSQSTNGPGLMDRPRHFCLLWKTFAHRSRYIIVALRPSLFLALRSEDPPLLLPSSSSSPRLP